MKHGAPSSREHQVALKAGAFLIVLSRSLSTTETAVEAIDIAMRNPPDVAGTGIGCALCPPGDAGGGQLAAAVLTSFSPSGRSSAG